MATPKNPSTPELDKMLANRDKSQAIGEFLDWLQSEKKVLLKQNEPRRIAYFDSKFEKEIKKLGENSKAGFELRLNNPNKWEEVGGVVDFSFRIEEILAEYFKVDLKKAEKERVAILDNLRK